jgi:hypothetical protein
MISVAEAVNEKQSLIAALEALRHPKPDFFRSLCSHALTRTSPPLQRSGNPVGPRSIYEMPQVVRQMQILACGFSRL